MATTIPAATQVPQTGPRLHRVLAAGGASFALVVIVQNMLRGASAPMNDAAVTTVLDYYSDHSGLALVLSATFVASGLCLAGFVAEVWRRLGAGGGNVWASIGVIGAVGVMGMFSMVVAMEAALVGAAGRETPDLGTIDALWLAHNAVFAVLGLALATALLGLGRACAAAGLVPTFFRWLAPVGAALLSIGTVAAPVLSDGSAMPAMLPSLLGFPVWLLLLICASVRMVRQTD